MGRKDIPETEREKLKKKFRGMMRALYRQEGAMLDVEVLRESEVLDFIDAHAAVLDSTFDKVKMSDGMRLSLQKSDWIFSGMKTFHELHEAFPSLLDEHGERKPFERFYSDVRKVDETYNRNYLRAEYNFATASAEMAAKWEQYERDGDRYYLQYRTVGDSHVREEHAAINGTTLPVSHPFWDTHYPPNGWNCRCLVVQVRKSSHEQTSEEELSKRTKALAEQQAKSKGKSEMFRFNPGKQRKVFPDYNPYTIKRCNDCDLAKGKFGKADANELCAGCHLLRKCLNAKEDKGKKARVSDEELRRIIAKPMKEQFAIAYEGLKGNFYEHEIRCINDDDYTRVANVGKILATKLGNCYRLPEIAKFFPDERKKIYKGLPSTSLANPDLYVEGLGYIDVKSPKRTVNVCRNANHASSKQHACVCITDDCFENGGVITEKQIEDRTNAIWKSPEYLHDYILWVIKGELRIYKRP